MSMCVILLIEWRIFLTLKKLCISFAFLHISSQDFGFLHENNNYFFVYIFAENFLQQKGSTIPKRKKYLLKEYNIYKARENYNTIKQSFLHLHISDSDLIFYPCLIYPLNISFLNSQDNLVTFSRVRGSLNKFPDFFRMGTFIDSTYMKL